MIWKIQDRTFDLASRGWIMGVLNVTPDSFSDGGQFWNLDAALAQARRMIAEGADIIDVGGESSRPGALSISEDEEMRRVLPVIAALRAESEGLISIDSCKPAVVLAAIRAGANIVNDIGGLREEQMRAVVAATGAGVVCMHMRGTPAQMQRAPAYEDATREVRAFFEERIRLCRKCGIEEQKIVFDPGIGFGKTVEHNLTLLRNLALLRTGDRPMLIGVSRKSFLSKIAGISKIAGAGAVEDRLWPTVALTAYCRTAGAEIVRVHDVLPNVQAMRAMEAIHG